MRKRTRWRERGIELDSATTIAAYEAGLEDPAAPTLVLLHGLGHWARPSWAFVGAELEATHRMIAFDLPGFGDSSKPDRTYDVSFFTSALARVVEEYRLEHFGVVGHSLGGHVAAAYAGTLPAGLRSLTLIDPGGFARSVRLFVRLLGGRISSTFFPNVRPSQRFVRWLYDYAVWDPAVIDEQMHAEMYERSQDVAMTRAFARVYRDAWDSFTHLPEVLERFGRWKGPTLVLWGREDRYVPIATLAAVRATYPNAKVAVFERCGHCPNLEYPFEVAQLIAALPA